MDKIRRWETEMTRRLVGFRRKSDETMIGYCTRTARMAMTIWKKMALPSRMCGREYVERNGMDM